MAGRESMILCVRGELVCSNEISECMMMAC